MQAERRPRPVRGLLHRYGDPAHPLVRFTRAYLYDDGDGLSKCAPDAVALLHGHGGQDYPADLELDDYVSALAARHRAQGPPILLYVALSMLGYSALLQRNPDLADRFFDEATSIDVPDRTVSVNKPIEARAAFRRGNRSAAFRILRAYVHELLETDYPDLAPNAAVEFINVMAAIDRLPAAARVLDYLRAAGDFGALATRTLVADRPGRRQRGPHP